MEDELYMRLALQQAATAARNGEVPIGAVIVQGNRIVGRGFNRRESWRDPTAHAEILAIRQASEVLATHCLNDCILYTSCEPCPMCLGAIYWSGIKTVFFAADRKDAAAAGFSDRFIYDEISIPVEKRHIVFHQLTEVDGKEAFRIWNCFENKIPY